MPELPEVEAVVRTLRPLAKGRRIRCVHVFHHIATKPQAASHVARHSEGRRIRVHVDVALELDKGVLGFADRRHFGRVHYWESVDACPGLKVLGIDALSSDFTANRLAKLLATSKRPLKDFLLDQSRIAGLGNIYSCESLWHARLDPRRRANTLQLEETRRLHKAIVSVLSRALECCLHPAPNFRDPEWWFQGLESILRVYGREGKPCRRCGEPIRRRAQGGRSTYYCGRCQE